MTLTIKPLAGQNAIVTGAGRGIGAAIAIALAKAGANVAVNDINSAADTVAACKAEGVQAIEVLGDVGSLPTVQSIMDSAEQQLGPLDILVSNAAYSDRELFYQADLAGFERTIQVCMWGPYYLSRLMAQRLIAHGKKGSMVFIGSPHAYKAIPGSCAYNMAKAALDQLARTAACELAEHRIRVNIVHPGWTDTPGERKFFHESELKEQGSQLPLGRMAKPEDIAHAVLFLCDPASEYMTGSTVTVDGGALLPFQEMFRVRNRPQT